MSAMVALLKKYKIKPNLLLDQNFMIDSELIEKIVSLAKIKRDEVILEIGSGFGNLTKKLAKKARKVTAIEIDERFKLAFKEELKGYDNVEVRWDNALNALKNEQLKFNKIVSNIPFSIAEPLIRLLTRYDFKLAILTVPKGFASRLTASLGNKNYSKLSLLAQAFFKIEHAVLVFKDAWYPKPKTESIVVEITPKNESDYKKEKVAYIIRQLFLQQDKKLKNALREAIINLYKEILNKKFTKRKARELIEKMNLSKNLLEKKISEIDTQKFKEVTDKLKF